METYFIYKITNTVNGKSYVGVTNSPKRREYEHFNGHGSSLVHLAIEKYGKECLTFELLHEGSKEDMYLKEKDLVSEHLAPKGYNICVGGLGGSPKGSNSGEKNNQAKLSEEDILYIRARASMFEDYQLRREILRLSDELGVIPKTIRNVVTGRTWKSVGGAVKQLKTHI